MLIRPCYYWNIRREENIYLNDFEVSVAMYDVRANIWKDGGGLINLNAFDTTVGRN